MRKKPQKYGSYLDSFDGAMACVRSIETFAEWMRHCERHETVKADAVINTGRLLLEETAKLADLLQTLRPKS